MTAAALKVGATPNQLTAASATTTLIGIVLVATMKPSPGLGVLAAALLLVAFALDAADGQLARLTDRCTAAGEWLDHVVDSLKTPGLHAAVLISWFRYFDLSHALLLIPILYGVESSGLFFSATLKDKLLRSATATAAPTSVPADSKMRAIVLLPMDYGVLALSIFALGFGHLFVAVYATLLAANLMALIGVFSNSWRQLRSIG